MGWIDLGNPWPNTKRICVVCAAYAPDCTCQGGSSYWDADQLPTSKLDELLERVAKQTAIDEVAEVWKDRTGPVGRLQGERVVFRAWNTDEDLSLWSTGMGYVWDREMVANAEGCHHHDTSPDACCDHCGLHAFYEATSAPNYGDRDVHIPGAIVVSGKVMLGPTGVRAEKARIVLLAYGNERQRVLAQGAAAKLGVGCCKLEDLERLSLEYGQPVPDEEKPQVPVDQGDSTWMQPGGFVPGRMTIGGTSLHAGATNTMIRNAVIGPGGTLSTGKARALTLRNLSIGASGVDVDISGAGPDHLAVAVDGEEWELKRPRRSTAIMFWSIYGTAEAFSIALLPLDWLTSVFAAALLLAIGMLVLNFKQESA